MAAFRPGKEASRKTKTGSNLIFDFHFSELWGNKSLSLRPPSLGCFVTAAIQKVHRSAQQILVTSQLYLVLDIPIHSEQVSES